MSKKIIQLSTKQCGRCQVAKRHIEKTLKNPHIQYEYISLADETKEYTRDTINEYWNEVHENFNRHEENFHVNINPSLPAFILKEEDSYRQITQEEVYNLIT